MTGSGTGDMMDLIVGTFKKEADEILDEDIPRFAVVGRPNAGKSSIVNAFIGEDRNIVRRLPAQHVIPSIHVTINLVLISIW